MNADLPWNGGWKALGKHGIVIAGVAGIYCIAARLSLILAFEKTNASPIWPPSGIAFALLLMLGPRVLPGIFLGAFAANAWGFESNQVGGPVSILLVSWLIALGNSAETATGVFLLRKWNASLLPMRRLQDAVVMIGAGAVMSLVSALIGPFSLGLAGFAPWEAFATIFFTWWLGDFSGILLMTPLILAWRSFPRWETRFAFWAEAAGGVLCLAGVLYLVFGTTFRSWQLHPPAYIIIPMLLWMVSRLGTRATTLAVAGISILALWSTAHGMGPFTEGSFNARVLMAQSFVGCLSITVLLLSGSIEERVMAFRAIQDLNAELEGKVSERTRTLEARTEELERANMELQRFNACAVGRELRIRELKEESATLKARLAASAEDAARFKTLIADIG